MPRLACGLEYDGACFSGWQRQHHAPSVQDAVENALSTIADHPIRTAVAGRTDAGVHAAGQVIHFDTDADRPLHAWQRGAGAHLPPSVSASWVKEVADDFHARYSATRRHYRYIILQRDAAAAGLLAGKVTRMPKTLDAERMHEAAQALLGEHDFTSFRAAECQARHPRRTLHRLDVTAHGSFVHLDVEADGFLYHMVRILAGALMEVGHGERPPEWLAELLEMRDRTAGGVTAPPDGLYLMRVNYPPECGIPPPLWTPDYSQPAS
ncbi:MAG: tRNA pseudouridine(38-40) synthase TruA [Gammaproteobacteria bacterium]|nr:tRNA pseudouridine(38-40) synthase TruA [Gammaproteobacteria bacterium]